MPLRAHLAALCPCFCAGGLAIALGVALCSTGNTAILAALQSPPVLVGAPVQVPQYIMAPAEALLTSRKVRVLAGLFLALPFGLSALWKCVTPHGSSRHPPWHQIVATLVLQDIPS